MPPKKTSDADEAPAFVRPAHWTDEFLLAHRGFGPALIGQAMYDAVQSLRVETGDGSFGPALLGKLPDSYKDQRTLAKQD